MLQIHRQKVEWEQQKTTKRRAPPAPPSPTLSSSDLSSRPATETGVGAPLTGFCSAFYFVFLPHDAVLARYMLSSCVCPSVCLPSRTIVLTISSQLLGLCFYFSLFFNSVPCARLSCPSHQLLSAR